jgi:2,4-dienoyl-CoA reductase-like NADH-dependent reductase (Old Yellow Enzyme family)
MTDTDILAQPLALPTETLPNRLAKAAMTEGLADADGRATPALTRLYERWAKGGAGLFITGNVIVDGAHLERPGNVILAYQQDSGAIRALQNWSKAARSEGAGLWMQLSHGGRQTPSLVNPKPQAPSAVPLALPGKNFGAPVAMTAGDIGVVVERFAAAAAIAREAGFTGVQAHAAHGYLLSSFLNPRANLRTDEWGGSLENRARFLLAVVKSIRAKAGHDFTLSVKLNSADFQKGGFAPGESIIVAGWLAEAGVDVLEISGGNYEQPRMANMDGLEAADTSGLPATTAAREAYFLDFAVEMQKSVKLPLMVTGGFRTAAAMARAVREDGVAIIGLGRPLVTQPDAPAKLLSGAAEIDRPEARLRVGPGWLGPHSPFATIKAINGFGSMYWYYQQIRRYGAGQDLAPGLGVLSALSAEQKAQAALMKQRR